MPSAIGSRNTVLDGLLARARWSPAQLADRVNERGRSLGFGAYLIERRSARRWVQPDCGRAKPSTPRDPIPGLACHLLSERLGDVITPEMLGWGSSDPRRYARADDGLDQPWSARAALAALARVVDADPMDRRHFIALTGAALAAVPAQQWLFDPDRVAASLAGKRVDHALVDSLEQSADIHRQLDDRFGGGGTLFPAVREQLRLATEMLGNASYTGDIGRRLHGVAAEFGRLAGWLAYDVGEQALAQRFYLAALRNAHVSGDRSIGGNILGFMSIQAARSDPRDAVVLARSALQKERELTPAVAASLHARVAVGSARSGDSETSRRAQDRSVELLGRSKQEDEPRYIQWFNQAETEAVAGQSFLALNEPDRAEPHLRRAALLLGPAYTRDSACMLVNLATARLNTRSVDQACETANEAAIAIRRLESPRALERLVEFRGALAPYAKSSAVREFDAKHGDLVGVSQA